MSVFAAPFELALRTLSERSWDAATARRERVAPLLYRRDYFDNAGRNVSLLEELDVILERLEAAGVRPVVLKGADLATRLYPNVAMRPMSDIDLWVPSAEVEPTEAVLGNLGLRPFCPEMTRGLNRRIRHARLFVGRGGVAVDLHWSLVGHAMDRRAPNLDWFRSRVVPSAKAPWLVLDDTACFLYLVAHAKLQHWDERVPLLWLVDVFLMAHGDLDWDELFERAREFEWTGALAAVVRETHERLGLTFPERLEAFAAETPVVELAPPPAVRGGPERALKELRDLDWRGRAALAASYLFPSPSYLRFRYRRLAWPLLYPARWASLTRSAVALAAKRLRTVRT